MAQGPVPGSAATEEQLQEFVAEQDTGAREPSGLARRILLGAALLWSLFQLWIASPLPFMLRVGVFNDTEARSIHLAFALFLAFLAYPATRRASRSSVPVPDWVLAVAAAFCAGYIFLFSGALANRPGALTTPDLVVGVVGILLLLEGTRRSLGPPLMIVAVVFLIYTFFGPYMPSLISHKGAGLSEVVNHQWITTEGVFGIALGVSTSFVFLFVLFGALLDKAGAGHYFMQLAFATLGHLRGGPAKAAVVSSALNGVVSGSSIANVVTGGTFTIPLMRRVGYTGEQAAAIEVSSSVNGQIMPPVMGAAAFLMVEYVGIPYSQIVRHAALPAIICYIALYYIVHLEALKLGIPALRKAGPQRGWAERQLRWLLGFAVTVAACYAVYYAILFVKPLFAANTAVFFSILLVVVYVALVAYAARQPDLPPDDPNVRELPPAGPIFKAGLHFILPVVVLVWCLMVEFLSPGLSAFYATALMLFILVTQRPLIALFRGKGDLAAAATQGFWELIDGLIIGARNMIGIAIATATAGIIVGAVSQTGVGAMLADLVEAISLGSVLLMLVLTALFSLILGMGLPTTANYIVVSSLLAPVIVELGQQNGLIVPLIAVHLFVFYFGIMADVTPPVGLASFAGAAIAGTDPIRTGFVATFYCLRTGLLPFLFIYNTDLLLIDVDFWHGVAIFFVATIAMLLFTAASMNYFLTGNRWYETVLLLLIAFMLFRPGFFLDLIQPPFVERPGSEIAQAFDAAAPGDEVRITVTGEDEVGNAERKVLILPVGEGVTGTERLESAGLLIGELDGRTVVDNAEFDSAAERAGFVFDQQIVSVQVPADRLPKEIVWLPGLLLLGLVVMPQRARLARAAQPS